MKTAAHGGCLGRDGAAHDSISPSPTTAGHGAIAEPEPGNKRAASLEVQGDASDRLQPHHENRPHKTHMPGSDETNPRNAEAADPPRFPYETATSPSPARADPESSSHVHSSSRVGASTQMEHATSMGSSSPDPSSPRPPPVRKTGQARPATRALRRRKRKRDVEDCFRLAPPAMCR